MAHTWVQWVKSAGSLMLLSCAYVCSPFMHAVRQSTAAEAGICMYWSLLALQLRTQGSTHVLWSHTYSVMTWQYAAICLDILAESRFCQLLHVYLMTVTFRCTAV